MGGTAAGIDGTKIGGTLFFGTVSGGFGAVLTNGNFWQGAATGLIVSGLNHVAHREDNVEENKTIEIENDCITCPKEGKEGENYFDWLSGINYYYNKGQWITNPIIGGSGSLELINPNKIFKIPSLLEKSYEIIKSGVTLDKIIDFFASEHRSNKRPSNWNKHTKPRAGRDNTKNRQKPNWNQNPNKRK
jgi:hypothetical protein